MLQRDAVLRPDIGRVRRHCFLRPFDARQHARLSELLGRGGFGTVHLYRANTAEQPVRGAARPVRDDAQDRRLRPREGAAAQPELQCGGMLSKRDRVRMDEAERFLDLTRKCASLASSYVIRNVNADFHFRSTFMAPEMYKAAKSGRGDRWLPATRTRRTSFRWP